VGVQNTAKNKSTAKNQNAAKTGSRIGVISKAAYKPANPVGGRWQAGWRGERSAGDPRSAVAGIRGIPL
jgi:hypothetical protein